MEILVKEGLLSEIRAGMPTRVVSKPSIGAVDTTQIGRLRSLHREMGDVIAELEAGARSAAPGASVAHEQQKGGSR